MRGPNAYKTARARTLRQVDNDAEAVLWSDLRGRRLNGFKFVRQLPVGPYFADFACRDKMLIVELDGSQHIGSGYDAARNAFMNVNGWSVARFWNTHILKERAAVLETIVAICERCPVDAVSSSDLMFLPAWREQTA